MVPIIRMYHVWLFLNTSRSVFLSSLPAIDYIVFLQSQAERQQQQLENLRKEVKALRIMKE